jgi:hypothetical protein
LEINAEPQQCHIPPPAKAENNDDIDDFNPLSLSIAAPFLIPVKELVAK